MKAIVIQEYGDPEVLSWQDVPDPEPGPGEVLIDVAASALNRADVMQRKGFYPPPPGTSPYPGLECSGTIAALGEGVEEWGLGDRVCALLTGGGYAERVVAPAGQVLPVPDGVGLQEAASLPEATCTVFSNLILLAHLQPGEVLLVHAGASGVGTAAIQIAKVLQASVLCTAGSDEKLGRCRELGADRAISYRNEDFVEVVREVTHGRGADVILDNMGAAYLGRNVDALAVSGRLVVIGLQGGRKGELNLGALMAKRAAVLATSLRARPQAEKAAIVAGVRRHVWPLYAEGAVRPVIDSTYPMDRAAQAHRRIDSGEHVGKILLTVPR